MFLKPRQCRCDHIQVGALSLARQQFARIGDPPYPQRVSIIWLHTLRSSCRIDDCITGSGQLEPAEVAAAAHLRILVDVLQCAGERRPTGRQLVLCLRCVDDKHIRRRHCWRHIRQRVLDGGELREVQMPWSHRLAQASRWLTHAFHMFEQRHGSSANTV